MIIFSTPGTGKTVLCREPSCKWMDGDDILESILEREFPNTLDRSNFSISILECFKLNREVAEECYTKFMEWMHENTSGNFILTGTRRFMWMADIVFIENNPGILEHRGRADAFNLIRREYESMTKWVDPHTPVINLNGRFLTIELINQSIKRYAGTHK